MEENKNFVTENLQEEESKSSIDFQAIFKMLILDWKWFVLSLIICIGLAAVYLRYTTPVYQASAKLLIKDQDNTSGRRNSIMFEQTLGMMSNSAGIDNEMEILTSHSIATQAVRDLKLYVTYKSVGKIVDHLVYGAQPINVDLDPSHLEKLSAPIYLEIKKESNSYVVTGKYFNELGDEITFNKSFNKLPATIGIKSGILSFNLNDSMPFEDGEIIKASITSPSNAAYKYVASLSVSQTSKTTTIAQLVLNDEIPQRAIDYLKELVRCYNLQANEDKNEIAKNTEAFINERIAKINAELGNTEGQLENYKRSNNVVDVQANAQQALSNQTELDKQLADANIEVEMLNSISEFMNQPVNKYNTLPSNVGLSDASATSLINKYNDIVLERKRLLRSASETSPTVAPLTSQLDDLSSSIHRALSQARRSKQIQLNGIARQYGKFSSQVSQTPEQERVLTQIGRQQEVKSGLYLMLLQKREENSITLNATADKGKLIDDPQYEGKISPKSSLIMLIALVLGISIPVIIILLIQFFRYKIEGHEDVVKLTSLPILADVAVASESAKTKADIVVHENQNNQMEEIFRSMRTNLQFMLKDNEKVIMFTSSISGEGKTFSAANLAVSFALLGKKIVLVGLDIRKPRLAELFDIDNHHLGITNLLAHSNPTEADVKSQIISSGVNNNLDLLLAGPVPPNPTELIARKSLDDVINILKKSYDYILIDTAPVGLVTDTLQISRVANATIFVCRADYTPKESFGLLNNLNKEKKMPNISVIINGIDMSKKKYGYYYGYGRYGNYGHYKSNSYYTSGTYSSYGVYGRYGNSHYGDKNDTSVKR